MKFFLLVVSPLLFSTQVFGESCEFNPWDMAYAMLDTAPDFSGFQLKAIEPDTGGPSDPNCPSFEIPDGEYRSTDVNCSNLRIKNYPAKDRKLEIIGFHTFSAINAGAYLLTYARNGESTVLFFTTKSTSNGLTENWAQIVNKLNIEGLRNYSATPKDGGLKTEVYDIPSKTGTVCSYSKF